MTTRLRCSELEAALSAYVDHEASPQELAEVEAHLQTCADCTQRLQHYRRLAARLDSQVRGVLVKAPAQVRWRRPPPVAWRAHSENRDVRPRIGGMLLAIVVVAGVLGSVALFRAVPAALNETARVPTPAPASPPPPSTPAAQVLVARLDGIVDPAEAAYVQRVIGLAETQHAQALVLNLEVSGGLDAPVGRLQQVLTESSVPVLTYVPGNTLDPAALRLARASALRGAGPEAAAGSATPADVVTGDIAGLLREADGRTVQTASGPATLRTATARVDTVEMEVLELLAHRLLDPTTAYLLFVLGLYAVFVEVAHPGALVPGLTGLVSLIVAIAAFGVLSINPVGALLIVVSVALMAIDVKALGHGALTVVGVGCMVVGSLLLYTHWGGGSPLVPAVAIAPPVVVATGGSGLLLAFGLARVAASVRRLPPLVGAEPVVGLLGVTRGALEPDGVVKVNGQLWSARLRTGQLGPGQSVRVRARHGLILEVEPATRSPGAATQKGTPR